MGNEKHAYFHKSWGDRLRGERLSYLNMYERICFLSYSQKYFLARSIVFYPPLRMQCALPTPFVFFLIFGVIISDCQLPKFNENAHKIAHNCAQNLQKLSAGVRVAEKGGISEKWGKSAMAVGWDRRPCVRCWFFSHRPLPSTLAS